MSSSRKGNRPRAASQKEEVEHLFVIAYGNFIIISWFLLVIHVGLKKKQTKPEECLFLMWYFPKIKRDDAFNLFLDVHAII